MNKDFDNTEEIEEMAELEATSDTTVQSQEKEAADILAAVPYVVPLSKEYDLDGEKISEVDLSGITDLSTMDAEYLDRVMRKLNHYPRNKFSDTTYTKHLAMRVTGLPIEFFNTLSMKDMYNITSRISLYFLF